MIFVREFWRTPPSAVIDSLPAWLIKKLIPISIGCSFGHFASFGVVFVKFCKWISWGFIRSSTNHLTITSPSYTQLFRHNPSDQSGRHRRNMEGRFIFGFCSQVGHTDSRCFQNPASPYYRGQDFPPQERDRREQPFINNDQGFSGSRRTAKNGQLIIYQRWRLRIFKIILLIQFIISLFLSPTIAFRKRPSVPLLFTTRGYFT